MNHGNFLVPHIFQTGRLDIIRISVYQLKVCGFIIHIE